MPLPLALALFLFSSQSSFFSPHSSFLSPQSPILIPQSSVLALVCSPSPLLSTRAPSLSPIYSQCPCVESHSPIRSTRNCNSLQTLHPLDGYHYSTSLVPAAVPASVSPSPPWSIAGRSLYPASTAARHSRPARWKPYTQSRTRSCQSAKIPSSPHRVLPREPCLAKPL